jgi:cyclic pyranopterin phosphate synthase
MSELSHVDEGKRAVMVDVGDKTATDRVAAASGRVRLNARAVRAVRENAGPKGPILEAARLAGILAAKKTAELIPLCHPLPIDHVDVKLAPVEDGVAIEAIVRVTARTGVEMEALTAVSVAALTVVDMTKALGHDAEITDIRVERKEGGKSGTYSRREKD